MIMYVPVCCLYRYIYTNQYQIYFDVIVVSAWQLMHDDQ